MADRRCKVQIDYKRMNEEGLSSSPPITPVGSPSKGATGNQFGSREPAGYSYSVSGYEDEEVTDQLFQEEKARLEYTLHSLRRQKELQQLRDEVERARKDLVENDSGRLGEKEAGKKSKCHQQTGESKEQNKVANWTERGSNTIMVDPMGELYIIANVYGGRGMIVNLPKSAWGQTNPVYVESGSFYAMYSGSHTDPEGGDISPDGSEIIIKISGHLYYYTPVNMDFISALTHPGIEVPYHQERLGEAVCWSADGRSYYTLGEDVGATLYRYDKQ